MRSSEDIDLLDLIVTAAESWRLLVIAPALVAAVVFFALDFRAKQYESVAVVDVSKFRSVLLSTPDAIEAILLSGGRLADADGIAAARSISTLPRNAMTGFVEIRTRGSNADRTQQLLAEFVAKLVAASERFVGKPEDVDLIENKISAYTRQSAQLEKIIDGLNCAVGDFPALRSSGPEASCLDSALRMSTQVRDNYIEIGSLKNALSNLKESGGASSADPLKVVVPPSPAKLIAGGERGLAVALSFVLAFLAVTAFVFARASLRKAGKNPVFLQKLSRIRMASARRHPDNAANV